MVSQNGVMGMVMGLAHVDLHLLVQAIIHDQGVGHSDAMRLHGVTSVVGIVSDVRVVEVSDLLGLRAILARRIQRRTVRGRVSHGAGCAAGSGSGSRGC